MKGLGYFIISWPWLIWIICKFRKFSYLHLQKESIWCSPINLMAVHCFKFSKQNSEHVCKSKYRILSFLALSLDKALRLPFFLIHVMSFTHTQSYIIWSFCGWTKSCSFVLEMWVLFSLHYAVSCNVIYNLDIMYLWLKFVIFFSLKFLCNLWAWFLKVTKTSYLSYLCY